MTRWNSYHLRPLCLSRSSPLKSPPFSAPHSLRPVPIPTPGVQLTTLTHVEDVASMLAAVPGNKKAIGQHYNVCSDRAITFTGITKAVGKALGKVWRVS